MKVSSSRATEVLADTVAGKRTLAEIAGDCEERLAELAALLPAGAPAAP